MDMKLRTFSIAFSLVSACTGLLAENRTESELIQIAQHLLVGRATRATAPEIDVLHRTEHFVVAGADGIGYAILAIDTDTEPVLGYSDSSFDLAQLNPALQWWMQNMESCLATTDVSTLASGLPEGLPESVDPYIKTHWNQSAPYNNLCPTYVSGGNEVHYPTGCVATAMAQAMYYYKYPAHGTGKLAYRYDPGTGLETNYIDLDTINFDWDNMLESYKNVSYTEEQATAVAALMNALGASIEMEYNSSGSGAQVSDACATLRRHLGYDAGLPFCSNWLGGSSLEFETDLYHYIAQKYPIIYGGVSSSGGHCFILDGYDAQGLVHVNWGWGGKDDGYFTLAGMNGFKDQRCYVPLAPAGTFPDYQSKLVVWEENVKGSLSISKKDSTHIAVNFSGQLVNADAEPYYGNLYVVARNIETGEECLLAKQENTVLAVCQLYNNGINKRNITISGKGVVDGSYHVFIGTRYSKENDSEGNPVFTEKSFSPIRTADGVPNAAVMEVADGKIASLTEESDAIWFVPTGIEEVSAEKPTDEWFSLSGHRVNASAKGLLISRGKVVFVK